MRLCFDLDVHGSLLTRKFTIIIRLFYYIFTIPKLVFKNHRVIYLL